MSCKAHGSFYCPDCYHVDPHPYTEAFARQRVARLRKRGIEASMHESNGSWFVVTPRARPENGEEPT